MSETAARVPHLASVDDGEREPASPEVIAEQAVLGSAIQSPDAAAEALAVLRPEFFSRSAHRVVFEAVERLADHGDPVEPATVLSELARAGMLAKTGGRGLGTGGAFLHSLMQRAGSVAYHAPIVVAAARRRNVRAVLESCCQIADGDGFDPDMHLEQIRKMVDDATVFAAPAALRPNSETVLEVLRSLETGIDPGLPTGFPDLDDAIGSMRDGELIVIGARPATGKTIIGECLADHVATSLGLPVLFSSLEMREAEVTQRRIAAAAKVPLHHIVRHQVSDFEWDLITQAQAQLLETELVIDDTTNASLGHIRGRLRTMARTGRRPRLLVIDYLGYLAAPKAESRQQAVAELARGCKILAREESIPVILLAQLNRGPESRADKVPSTADLRESGEIEQSADIVILLHRPDAYERESKRAGEIDLLITKNRQGPQMTVTLCFQGHYGRIVSMAGRPWSATAQGES